SRAHLVGRTDERRLAEERPLLLLAELLRRRHGLPFDVLRDVARGDRPVVVALEHVVEAVGDVAPRLLVRLGAVAGDELEDVEVVRVPAVTRERVEILLPVMPDADGREMEPEAPGAIDRLLGARTDPDRERLL